MPVFECSKYNECTAQTDPIMLAPNDASAAAGVHVVRIQDLPEGEGRQACRGKPHMADIWKRSKCTHRGTDNCTCTVLTCFENCEATLPSASANGMFSAFLEAYNNHQDILLAPDDVWLLVCLHFSKYVNKNAEQLRDVFVDHEGKKQLRVTTWNDTSESQWDEFFMLIKTAIANSTKADIVHTLDCAFSTTGLVEQMMSTAAIMDSFKEYFSYGRCIPMCGIRNACFLGTRDDWNLLLQKTMDLSQDKYDVQGVWKRYIAGVEAIIRKLIDTYDGKVDKDWWNGVMNAERGRLGSGSTTYYSGWILHLFGQYEKCESCEISSYSIDVPVKIDNKATGETKTVHLVGGFEGVHAMEIDKRKAFRPQTSMIVFYDPENQPASPRGLCCRRRQQ